MQKDAAKNRIRALGFAEGRARNLSWTWSCGHQCNMGSEFWAQTGNRIFVGIDCVWRGDKEKSAFCKAAQMCVETAGNQPLGQCPQATAAPLGPAWRESLCRCLHSNYLAQWCAWSRDGPWDACLILPYVYCFFAANSEPNAVGIKLRELSCRWRCNSSMI